MFKSIIERMRSSIKTNILEATLSFIFIIAYVNVFQMVFGAENSIVGVIFTIMMSASMVRDMTAAPLKHLLAQAAVLVWMGISACLVTVLPPAAAFVLNLATIFLILYAFTYEYSSHMYFPYILSYLFLIFISPVEPAALPKRLLGLLVGAASIILYQLFRGRKRVAETARDVLSSMIDDAVVSIRYLLGGEGKPADLDAVRRNLCKLSRTVYDRRKKALCISDASFSMIDAGRGIEHLIILLHDLQNPSSARNQELLSKTARLLAQYRAYVQKEIEQIPALDDTAFIQDETDAAESDFYHALAYVRGKLMHMSDPEKRTRYRKTMLSWSVRIKAALGVSEVRVVYALRVSVLLAVFTLIVQLLQLPHGKWLLFTLASLSLPYADDVGAKTSKRIIATVIGGMVSVAVYALIPSMAGRTAVMMFSGYLSFYFSQYTGTYACSTIGALGGAVIMDTFGWGAVGQVFAVRLCYIAVGAVIALAANCLLFPYKRSTATRQLVKKYTTTTELLARVCADNQTDTQLYYSLVIQAHLLEDKLSENAQASGWSEMQTLLVKCRQKVRDAHRSRPACVSAATAQSRS
ncbi:FUSC family protein [Candidatus Soleaferrea massiliensis]|uniref:FUSC family protein n=1 Tax=Candidatus Soleaferrea massiliensis TaxID=1470354 RepID=UPI000AF324A7|nr:FUSC family protein [Candidatus Soleaferrea massiliensis]